MKLLFTLKNTEAPGHEALHQLVLRALGANTSDLQAVADQLLQESQPLIKSGQLKNELLAITIHKVRSTEWNILMVRYQDRPVRYHAEIRKELPQTTLFGPG